MYYPDGAKLLKKALVNEPMLPLTEWIVNQAEEVSASELYAVSIVAKFKKPPLTCSSLSNAKPSGRSFSTTS
jgi:hypothetical protein